jgi:predicted dienelactone hydrolase
MHASTRICVAVSLLALLGACDTSTSAEPPADRADVTRHGPGDALPEARAAIAPDAGPFGLQAYCHENQCAAGPDAAPDPALWGPYPVGVRTIALESVGYEGETRQLTVEIWYPAVESAREGPFEHIDIVDKAPAAYAAEASQYAGMATVDTLAVRDAPADQAAGPYPLVLFSHGAYGLRVQSVFFTVFLASHGYVVASPDHQGNTIWDMLFVGYDLIDVGLNAFDRPLDVLALLDDLLGRNATPGAPLAAMIDPTRVGVSGHSFGGYTCFRLAFGDPRIKAIVPMTPSTLPLGFEFLYLKDLEVPTMVMAGELDVTLDTQTEMKDAYDQMPGPENFYVSLAQGGHYTYSDICEIDMLTIAQVAGIDEAEDLLNDGCGPDNIPADQAHPLIRQFAVGFFNHQLRDSDLSADWYDAAAADAFGDALVYEGMP